MLDDIASKLFFINACSSGTVKFENVKWFLAKIWKYITGAPKVVEEEKKEKNRKLPMIQRSMRRAGRGSFRRNGKLAGRCYSMIAIRKWFGWGKLLGKWKLIRASAFWGLLALMANALKIKCQTLKYDVCIIATGTQGIKEEAWRDGGWAEKGAVSCRAPVTKKYHGDQGSSIFIRICIVQTK